MTDRQKDRVLLFAVVKHFTKADDMEALMFIKDLRESINYSVADKAYKKACSYYRKVHK